MENIVWKYVKPIKNDNVVMDFLCQYDIKLPQEMIQCLTQNNGGRPSVYLFNTVKRKGYVFQSLFSYNLGDKCNIFDVYPGLFETTPLFPIGLESAGNIVCYNQKEHNYVLWNHENNECEKILMD